MNILNIIRPGYNECELNGHIIDSKVIVKNKCFHGDILNDDLSIKSSERGKFFIGGVIKLKNN